MFETTDTSISPANMFGSDAYYYDPQDFDINEPSVSTVYIYFYVTIYGLYLTDNFIFLEIVWSTER